MGKSEDSKSQPFVLPKDALSRINLGQTFAENDKILLLPNVFVKTPASQAAMERSRSKCFYVGRRGTGKTAISTYLTSQRKNVVQIHPEIFSSLDGVLGEEKLDDPRQKPFQALTASFVRSILNEVVNGWLQQNLVTTAHFPTELRGERNYITDFDFDTRIVDFITELFTAQQHQDEKEWLKLKKKAKTINESINRLGQSDKWTVMILIDRLDDSWDGSDRAVMMLTALMHACVEVWSISSYARPIVFLRENIFERVRQKDKEFTRLETSVVSLDWTTELLTEVVERRLVHHLNTKPKTGEAWDLFFEPQCDGLSSKDYIFNFCQHRPRDVLTYCSMAVEFTQRHRRPKIAPDDLKAAKRRFSQSRFKDLGDEYSENYPQIQVVLSKFHSLAKEISTAALAVIHRKLLADDDVKTYCHEWVYTYGDVYQFIELLYGIGFWGVRSKGAVSFRGVGTAGSSLPAIDLMNSSVVVHPTYVDALDLRDEVIDNLPETINLQIGGGLLELPDGATLAEHHCRLYSLMDDLSKLPSGQAHDDKYEEIVYNVISLCLRPYLGNVQKRSRTVDNRAIRDIIATNVASGGFWSMARQQYHATQVIWECKNYETLQSSVFQQATYYLNKSIGFFLILCHRGTDSDKSHYYEHIRRAAAIHITSPAVIIPLNDKDLKVFIRQAINHKTKDDHIHNIHDEIIRKIS